MVIIGYYGTVHYTWPTVYSHMTEFIILNYSEKQTLLLNLFSFRYYFDPNSNKYIKNL